jgi:putative ABC transport system permease protein
VAGEEPQTYMRPVTADFFDVMGIPVEDGRAFTDLDVRESAAVALVNRAFVRRYLPDGRALNRAIRLYSRNWGPLGRVWNEEVEVVGVVGDVRYAGLTEEAVPAIYLPYAQAPFRRMTMVLAGDVGEPGSLLAAAREGVARVDDRVAISGVSTLEDVLRASTLSQRFTATLLLVFGCMALIVAMVGIYGVVSYQVAQRVPEMAVRMSIGASPRKVLGLTVRSGVRVWGAGIAVGMAGAMVLRRVVASQLHGVSATDPTVFAGAALVLGAVSFAATLVPAVRSTRIAPADVLRNA